MQENTLIYEIKNGETISEIAAKIGMPADQLLDFHNQHCEKMGKLWFNNLAGVSKIIVPKKYISPEQLLKEQQKFLPSKKINTDFFANSYSISETISKTEQKDVEITYKANLNGRKENKNNTEINIVEVICRDYKKNGQSIDDKMGSISLDCMESISPIPFIIEDSGAISGIYDHKNLVKKFKSKRPELEDFYIGEIYTTYLDSFSKKLEEGEFIFKQLKTNFLYQVLFPNMDYFHQQKPWVQEWFFIQNSLPLRCTMNAEYNYEDTEVVKTSIKGHTNDHYSLPEVLRGVQFDREAEEPIEGEIKIDYETDRKTKQLKSVNASFEISFEGEIYRKHNLKITI